MIRFLAWRLVQLVPTLLGITLVTFAIAHLVPGEPTAAGAGELGVSRAAIAEFRETMGLDLPLPEQYGHWLKRVAHLDFGRSLRDGRPVIDKIRDAAPVTAVLAGLSLLFVTLVGIPLGMRGGLHPGSAFEFVSRGGLLLLHSLPSFWVAVMLLSVAGGSNWMPVLAAHGGAPSIGDVMAMGRELVVPVFCLSFGSLAVVARQVSGSLREVLATDYIRTARAKGLSERAVLVVHALPNAALPTLTTLGSLLPHLLGGSVIVESIFGLPGLGQLGFEAVGTRDYDALMGVTVVGALCTLVANLVTDLLSRWIDPRLTDAPLA